MSWRPRGRFLGQRHGRYGLEYRYHCPRCHSDNLWWIPGRGGGMCWNCEALYGEGKLDLKKAQTLFRDFSAGDEIALLVEELNMVRVGPAPTRPRVEVAPEEEEGLHWKARWFLEKQRNVPLDHAVRAGTWYEEGRDKLHFPLSPILPTSGEVLCSMVRTPDPEIKDWRFEPRDGPKQERWYSPVELGPGPIAVVEGPFDILAAGLLGKGVGLCGTQLYEDAHFWLIKQRKTHPKVYLWLDPDEAGKAAALKIEKQIKGILPVVRIDYEKEPGDCTPEEAMTVLRERGWV